MAGWIKIYREIQSHWIWRNPAYLKAWLNILLTVNFEDKKVLIESELIECKRGQALFSLQSWVKILGPGWTPQKVRTFFNLLKNDSMIDTEGMRKTTRLTVCNYELYQDLQQADNKQITSRQQADNKQITTTKEYKKDKELKEGKEIIDLFNSVVIFFDEKLRPDTDSAKAKWIDCLDKLIRIDGYSPDHIREIIKRARMDDFWKKVFLSVAKLRNSNKDGVKYFVVFENQFNGKPVSVNTPEGQKLDRDELAKKSEQYESTFSSIRRT